MDPTERIFATCQGEEIDRVPTMSILYDLNPIYQVLGYPKKTDADLINTWFGQFFFKKIWNELVREKYSQRRCL